MFFSCLCRRVMAATAVLTLTAAPVLAGGPICWRADEVPAVQLHAFQMMLMTGTLKCRLERPEVLAGYNGFIQARKSALNASRYVLKAHFIRLYGAEQGESAFLSFDTAAGNRASLIDRRALPCEAVAAYSRVAASGSDADLYALARVSSPAETVPPCGVGDGSGPTTLAAVEPPAGGAAARPGWPK